MLCDSVSSGSEVSALCEMGWGGMGSAEERGRDRASAKHGLSPMFPDSEMGYVSICLT